MLDINWWLFIGVAIIVVGFAMKVDSIAVVIVAAVVTALIGGIGVVDILETLGKNFVGQRGMSMLILTLPLVAISERYGLKEQAVKLIQKVEKLTVGRLLWLYQLVRQSAAAASLKLGGHPQFVRPLIYPMAEGAARVGRTEPLDDKTEDLLKGAASASDNYANFFGQMLFPASAGVALIVGTLKDAGYPVTLSEIALWSVPVFVIALVLSAVQFTLLDKKLKRGK